MKKRTRRVRRQLVRRAPIVETAADKEDGECWITEDRLNRRSLRVGAVATLVALLLSLGATSAAASSGVVVKEPQYGFSFTLPVSWKQVPLDRVNGVTTLLNDQSHNDYAFTHVPNGEFSSAVSKGTKVFAIGPSGDNLSVLVVSSVGNLPESIFAPGVAAAAKSELTQASASHIKTSIVNNPLGRSAQVTYELNLLGGHEFGDQFYVQHNSNVEIVTVTTGSLAASQSNGRLIVNSWRW